MRLIAFVIALMAPLPALALSCMAPTVEHSFERFQASQDVYSIVHGRLTVDTSLLPKGLTQDRDPPEMTLVPAQLAGKSLGKAGFRVPFERQITLEVSCIGPWCGGVQNGVDVLAFVQKTDAGYVLAVPPCGGSVFTAPKAAQLKRAKQCYRAGTCE
jgi:hypothetical protein